jgi:WD40 repeat protein
MKSRETVCLLLLLATGCVQAPRANRSITYVAVSEGSRLIAIGGAKGAVQVCDLDSLRWCRDVVAIHGTLNDLRFSPNGRLLAIADRDLRLWSADAGRVARLGIEGISYGTARFNGNGTEIVTVDSASRILVFDVGSRKVMETLCCSSLYGEVAFAPDGRRILNAGHWPRVWDEADGRLETALIPERQEETFGPIAFDEDLRMILMGSQDGRVYAWDLNRYQLVTRSRAQAEYVRSIATIRMGTYQVAYAGSGTQVTLWNPKSGEERELPLLKPTSNLCVLSDGRSLLFGTVDGGIEIWDVSGIVRRRR